MHESVRKKYASDASQLCSFSFQCERLPEPTCADACIHAKTQSKTVKNGCWLVLRVGFLVECSHLLSSTTITCLGLSTRPHCCGRREGEGTPELILFCGGVEPEPNWACLDFMYPCGGLLEGLGDAGPAECGGERPPPWCNLVEADLYESTACLHILSLTRNCSSSWAISLLDAVSCLSASLELFLSLSPAMIAAASSFSSLITCKEPLSITMCGLAKFNPKP